MTGESSGSAAEDRSVVEEVVELFETLDFTEYEARCFVGLERIRQGTAKEVSEVADVPRARVYDCMDGLKERGLVDVQQGSPREFRAVDPDEAVSMLDRQLSTVLDRIGTLLPRLQSPASEGDEDGDVWVMEGDAEVSERMEGLLDDATDEVLLAIAVEELLTDELLTALRAASDRGVDIVIGSPAESVRERLRTALPEARVQETWTWWDSHPIQPGAVSAILMVDGAQLLVSADIQTSLPGVRKHRAVWTDGDTAPLVGMMRPLLADAIQRGGQRAEATS
ncbi:transcriptional regulator TrmB protein [Halorhabdus tiamatea SARL4B]|uniref:Archaeal sugar-specific transcriptional regulator, TrmB family n=1 Tax=Halorhabdus tiamatea SARL4B TaxID=1033806 RepID=F7PGT7_9EURY|nr:helix-turn-helix domain-containing protein [Halorhabdus tiamatea]ERJ06710.1 transcriptional regulator TrmB protein [Halorhabdus tiamatea SARL4B]CCQ33900.1 archaeal sugar-specific transcriptional regulator, TrmB family [Halorhabdus tiamatea SARL4B]